MKAGDEYVFLLSREQLVKQFDRATGAQFEVPVPYDLVVAAGKIKTISALGIELENGVVVFPVAGLKAVPKALLEQKKEETPAGETNV